MNLMNGNIKGIKPIKRTNPPWPMSPNITPNWNGNVTMVDRAGLTSRYLHIP